MFNWIISKFRKRPANYHNNEIKHLSIYRLHNTWMFDDPFLGIIAEPFVPSASEVITELTKEYYGLDTYDTDILIGEDLEQYDAEINLVNVNGGSTYKYKDKELWLCPVLLRFFEYPPERIRVKFL